MSRVLNKDVKFLSAVFEEDFKVDYIGQDLRNFLVDDRELPLNNIISNTRLMHTTHIKIIG